MIRKCNEQDNEQVWRRQSRGSHRPKDKMRLVNEFGSVVDTDPFRDFVVIHCKSIVSKLGTFKCANLLRAGLWTACHCLSTAFTRDAGVIPFALEASSARNEHCESTFTSLAIVFFWDGTLKRGRERKKRLESSPANEFRRGWASRIGR